jgi:GNAT superfamily N-acetyltransferase
MEFRRMNEGDFDGVLKLMVKAFFSSTLYTWAAADEGERLKILDAMFRCRIRGWLEDSREVELALEGGHIVGSATWLEVAAAPQSGGPSLDAVFDGWGATAAERWSKFQAVIETQEKNMVPPAWELAPIAVLPEKQGKKIGAALITKKLALIDAAGLPCYLCTQDRKNLAIYERFGFRKQGELFISEGGPVSYTMKREGGADPRQALPLLTIDRTAAP